MTATAQFRDEAESPGIATRIGDFGRGLKDQFFKAQFVNCMRHLVTAAARQARSLAPGARPTRWNQLR